MQNHSFCFSMICVSFYNKHAYKAVFLSIYIPLGIYRFEGQNLLGFHKKSILLKLKSPSSLGLQTGIKVINSLTISHHSFLFFFY